MSVKFYSRRNVARVELDCSRDGMTVQSDAKDCDINVIMHRYRTSGVLPLNILRNKKGIYADVSEFGDYRSCFDKVVNAERMFMSLPSLVRKRFENDPAQFLAFASDPRNAAELVDLGLAVERTDSPRRASAPKQGAPTSESSSNADGGAPGPLP